MKKTYLLDTNVYMTDANALFKFEDNDIIIPTIILDEIDRHKSRQDSAGAHARQFNRILDGLRSEGSLYTGISLGENKGTIKVVACDNENHLPAGFDKGHSDNKMLAAALSLTTEVIIVSRDINFRVKCDAVGIPCEGYENEKVVDNADDLYSGVADVLVPREQIDLIYSGGEVILSVTKEKDLYINQYLVLGAEEAPRQTILVRYQGKGLPLRRLHTSREEVWGLRARNKEQEFAIDALMDPNIKLVTLVGRAGSGKTLIAIASGMEQVIQARKHKTPFTKLMVSKPVEAVGKDIGFLPGPQPLDAKILTPFGWSTMGEMKIGSEVITEEGISAEVLGVYDQGVKDIYQVKTTDGRVTECCADHLWFTTTNAERRRPGNNGKVRTLLEIKDTLHSTDKKFYGKLEHILPKVLPVVYKTEGITTKDIPPYVMGALLGDGSFGKSGKVCIASIDEEIVNRIRRELEPMGCELSSPKSGIVYSINGRLYNNKTAKRVQVTGESGSDIYHSVGLASAKLGVSSGTIGYRCKNNSTIDGKRYNFLEPSTRWTNPVREQLHLLGLLGKTGQDKFVPRKYMTASIEDRLNLLRGLMDTDGGVNKKKGSACFWNTSYHLASSVCELVRSLGGTAKISERHPRKSTFLDGREIKSNKTCYEVNLSIQGGYNPFYLARKAKYYKSKYSRMIKIESIEKIGLKEARCIRIGSTRHLYVTDDFIVTHNTLEEKLGPWLAPIKDNLEALMGDKVAMETYMEQGVIEIEAITFIRGRSIANAYMIIDEAQNLNVHEIKTILTRVADGTKIILTGDIQQIDNSYVDAESNGLTYAVEKFKSYEISAHITLSKGERSELATLAAEIL